MYNIIKRYFDRGIYTVENVAVFVRAGRITPQEFEQITGMRW